MRVWDTQTLATIQVLGLGSILRAVACLAFSTADPSLLVLFLLICPQCLIAQVSVDDSANHTVTLWAWETGVSLNHVKG